ncbi:Uncharacterised protein [Mycobacteroides abscessus subsp. massiliense]|nr:Uncharacterised protein [Mycobacteroides abscessus subsp. massiliense]
MQLPVPEALKCFTRLQARAVEEEQHCDGNLGRPVEDVGSISTRGKHQSDPHRGEQPQQEPINTEFGQPLH